MIIEDERLAEAVAQRLIAAGVRDQELHAD